MIGLQSNGSLHLVLVSAGYDPDQCDLSEEQAQDRVALMEQLSDVVLEELPVNKAMQELCLKAAQLKIQFDQHRENDETSIHHDSSFPSDVQRLGLPPMGTMIRENEDVGQQVREGAYQ